MLQHNNLSGIRQINANESFNANKSLKGVSVVLFTPKLPKRIALLIDLVKCLGFFSYVKFYCCSPVASFHQSFRNLDCRMWDFFVQSLFVWFCLVLRKKINHRVFGGVSDI